MEYENINKERISRYLAAGEKKESDFKIGIEIEHFIIDKNSLATVYHFDDNGSSFVIEGLKKYFPQDIYVDGNLMGLGREDSYISLEPAGQLEISINPKETVAEIETEYKKFLCEANQLLNPKGLMLFAGGYHPVTKIDELKIIPKKRYEYMSQYLKHQGKYALNMMKGTCSVQVSIDYFDEDDFVKKFRLANILACAIYFLTDNVKVFEGQPAKNLTRMRIWQQTDPDRSCIPPQALDKRFGYDEYAQYVYDVPPIVTYNGGDFINTGSQKLGEIYKDREMTQNEIEYALSLLFPDARAKHYIEIRPADSMPVEQILGYAALIKGIFYSDNLDKYSDRFSFVTSQDEKKAREALMTGGSAANVYGYNIIDLLTQLADSACELLGEEKKYLDAVYEMIKAKKESVTLLSRADDKRDLV